jgi:RNA polymerase sigma factor (sigma-70 family)
VAGKHHRTADSIRIRTSLAALECPTFSDEIQAVYRRIQSGKNAREPEGRTEQQRAREEKFRKRNRLKVLRSADLTERQREVLSLSLAGLSQELIGERLGITRQAVAKHLNQAKKKF